jgi:hypothetical protein
MPETIAKSIDGADYERCLLELKDKGDARYGICMNAYKQHHEKDPETGGWIRKKGHNKNEKGEWIVKNFKGFDDWIEIFRGGPQVDSHGVEHDGDKLIDDAVETFNPGIHEPPVVVGHPEHNAPAFGWVNALKTEIKDGVKTLFAKAKNIVPEFERAVEEGRYKKRSASFYPDGKLRHVGFLGAAPPAVKGLADLKFDDDDKAYMFEYAEFSAAQAAKKAQEARSKQYGIGIKEGGHVTKPGEWDDVPDDQFLDPVNYRYPCPDADQTRAAAGYWGREKNRAQYSAKERGIIEGRLDKFRKQYKIGEYRKEEKNMSDFKQKIKGMLNFLGIDVAKIPEDALPNELPGSTFSEEDIGRVREQAAAEERKKAEAEFAERQRKTRENARKKEISDWVEQKVEDGKILPSWANSGLVIFMQGLDGEKQIEFSDGAEKKSPLQFFQDFLENFEKSPIFREIATKEKAGHSDDFTEAKKDQEIGEGIAAKVNPKEQGGK